MSRGKEGFLSAIEGVMRSVVKQELEIERAARTRRGPPIRDKKEADPPVRDADGDDWFDAFGSWWDDDPTAEAKAE